MNIKLALTIYMILSLICSFFIAYYNKDFEGYRAQKNNIIGVILLGLNLITLLGSFLCILAILYVGIEHILFFIPSNWGQFDSAFEGWTSYRNLISLTISIWGGVWIFFKMIIAIIKLKGPARE